MGFFSPMPKKPDESQKSAMRSQGKVPCPSCEGRGRQSIGGNVIECRGPCKGTGWIKS